MAIAYQIAKTSQPVAGMQTGPVKSKTYLSWLHDLPCVVTGMEPVQAAHVSFANARYGAPGRGKGRKVSDRWALPLSAEKHDEQHKGNEKAFWVAQGINPHLVACILWGMWSERKDGATEAARKMILSGQFKQDIAA